MKNQGSAKRNKTNVEKETVEQINVKSDAKAFQGMCLVAVAIIMYQSQKGLPFGDVPALLFTFLSIGMFYRYRALKDKVNLIWGIGTGLTAILLLVLYVLKTM